MIRPDSLLCGHFLVPYIDIQSDIAFYVQGSMGMGLRGDRSQAIPKSKLLSLTDLPHRASLIRKF